MRTPKFEIYRAKDGFRWRLKASNGRIIAESGEAYKKHPIKRVLRLIYDMDHIKIAGGYYGNYDRYIIDKTKGKIR